MDKWKRGSFTVEAALLVPMLVYVMVAMLYVDFCLYDRVVGSGICCQAAWQLHMAEESDETEMQRRMEAALSDSLLCSSVCGTDCSVNDIYIRTDCTVAMEIPLPGLEWVLGNVTGYETEHTAVVSGLASMTVFRKLCAAEDGAAETESAGTVQ